MTSRVAAWAAALSIAVAVFVSAACLGGDGCPAGVPAGATAQRALTLAQAAVDCAAGYRITLDAHNIVLPEWGGTDGGTVDVGRDSDLIRAHLTRTGDGPYDIILASGQTYFRRVTCDHWARRSGGAPDVLRPFAWNGTDALADATDAEVVEASDATITVAANIKYLGPVHLTIDRATTRPVRLEQPRNPVNGTESAWTFGAWNQPVEAWTPPEGVRDQGLGGNPC